jgi:hypothetical protein
MGKFDNIFAYSLAGGAATVPNTGGGGGGTAQTTGLVAHWTMNETSGNRLDSSGNNHTLIPSGAIASAAGKFGNAAVFNGTAKLSLASASQLNLASDFSVSFWVKFSSVATYAILFSKYLSSPVGGLAIDFLPGSAATFRCVFAKSASSPELVILNSSTNIILNQYYFVALTHNFATKTLGFSLDNQTAGITADTVSGQPNPYTFTMTDNALDIVVGGWAADTLHIPSAQIDQVRIYNRVLTPAEVSALYLES